MCAMLAGKGLVWRGGVRGRVCNRGAGGVVVRGGDSVRDQGTEGVAIGGGGGQAAGVQRAGVVDQVLRWRGKPRWVKASARPVGLGIGVAPWRCISAHSWRAAISADVRGANGR